MKLGKFDVLQLAVGGIALGVGLLLLVTPGSNPFVTFLALFAGGANLALFALGD